MGTGRLRKTVALVLLVSVAIAFSAGCFGKFQLTRKVYEINQSIQDKYLRSAVTWVFVIIPVYGVAGILDFILFNVIEFWSGENPVTGVPQTRVYARAGEKAVMTVSREDGATVATIETYRDDRLVSTVRIRDDGNGSVASQRIENGVLVRSATAAESGDGSVSVTVASSSGTTTTRYSPGGVETVRSRVARISRDVRDALAAGGGGLPSARVRVPVREG